MTITTVRPEPVEGRRLWFDRALLSLVEGLTTNGINVVMNYMTVKSMDMLLTDIVRGVEPG